MEEIKKRRRVMEWSEGQNIERELVFGALGKHVIVADRLCEVNGNYQKVARIDSNRRVTYYVQDLESKYKTVIERAAQADS